MNPEVPIRDLVRNIVSDKSSAYTAAQAISAALFARERGAGGQLIEVPMLDASLGVLLVRRDAGPHVCGRRQATREGTV